VTYSYDAARRLQTRTVVGETAVSYAWDNAGNPLSAVQGSATLSYAYDSAGRVSSVTMPNGVVVADTYDSDSRIAQIAYSKRERVIGQLDLQLRCERASGWQGRKLSVDRDAADRHS
jgi:YD repeat-containing protein